MTEYVMLVFVSCIIGILVPGFGDGGMKKPIRFLSGIILLIALVDPIQSWIPSAASAPKAFLSMLFPDTGEMEEIENKSESMVIEYSVANIESGVCALIENRYGVPSGSVRAEAKTGRNEAGEVTLESLLLYVKFPLTVYAEEIERYVSDLLACPCDVIS